jgi:hypothetical protein
MYRTIITTCLLMAIALSPLRSGAQEMGTKADKAAQWELAAANRECAAITQSEQALQYSRQSEDLQFTAQLNDEQRLKALSAAANALGKAGDLEGKASRNSLAAAKNWQRVVAIWKGLGEESKQAQAMQEAASNAQYANQADRRSAIRYELAADLYGQLGPAGAGLSATMSEKAAGCRERIAAR